MRIERTDIEDYQAYLKDKNRPPSKGGNTRAWHSHVLIIRGEKFSFLALGARKWVFASDTVSFEWNWNDTQEYRNIAPDTIKVWDKDGNEVVRGERGTKPWRTATTRLPGRRREWKD